MLPVGKILTNKHLPYVLGNFTKELLLNPHQTIPETYDFFAHWLLGKTETPIPGLKFEQHSHSHFSHDVKLEHGAELGNIVNKFFNEGYAFWSLTDHSNTNAFDSIANGSYNLQETTGRKYEHEVSEDGRYMTLHLGEKKLVLLRSIEYWTTHGEIGIHGFKGNMPKEKVAPIDAIRIARDNGGYVVINHPYFWEGLGYHGNDVVHLAAQAGAVAIEFNRTEIPPQVYSPIRAKRDAKKFNLSLVETRDPHTLDMYGEAGLVFNSYIYRKTLDQFGGNDADAIKFLVTEGAFTNWGNYVTPKQFLEFFSFSDTKTK